MSDREELDFVPSTDKVRSHYVFDQGNRWSAERGERFDRWLAARDARVKAEALEDAAAQVDQRGWVTASELKRCAADYRKQVTE